jgi:guanyl-specific ribonuclease Sa
MKKWFRSRWLCLILAVILTAGLFTGCKAGTGQSGQEAASTLTSVSEETQETASTLISVSDDTQEEASALITVPDQGQEDGAQDPGQAIEENGSYTTKEDVALYIHTYGKLPPNFITKKAAQKLGWEGGSLEPYAPGKCIGGNYFGNYEGILPEGNYKECDIDTLGKKSRGAKRIIYSDDGRIYYTEDHYKSFTQLY